MVMIVTNIVIMIIINIFPIVTQIITNETHKEKVDLWLKAVLLFLHRRNWFMPRTWHVQP